MVILIVILTLLALGWILLSGFNVAYFYISTFDIDNDKALEPSLNFYNGTVSALLNAVVIIFVYLSFKLQRKEILNSTNNHEFNRAIDIIYRELDISKTKDGSQNEHLAELNNLAERIKMAGGKLDMKSFISLYISEPIDILYRFNRTFNVFKDLAYNNSLTVRDVKILINIVDNNYLKTALRGYWNFMIHQILWLISTQSRRFIEIKPNFLCISIR